MTTIQLHPRSLVLGLALGACALLALAQSAPTYASTVRVQYMPHPRDMVQIEEGVPFTVPVGKILVVTGLGSTEATTGFTELLVNGALAASIQTSQVTFEMPSVRPIAPGFTARAGDSVSVSSVPGSSNRSRAWGYLADQ